jgi:hypothetical protein
VRRILVLETMSCVMACRRRKGSEALGCVACARVWARGCCGSCRESRLTLSLRGRRSAVEFGF